VSYLFKRLEIPGKTVFEFKTKNFYIFVIIILLSLIPAVYISSIYFYDNLNLFRILYVTSVIIAYIILSGGAIIKILFTKNKVWKGSPFSFRNPVKYTIENKT